MGEEKWGDLLESLEDPSSRGWEGEILFWLDAEGALGALGAAVLALWTAGYSMEEVARRLGVSWQTARYQLDRARLWAREYLSS